MEKNAEDCCLINCFSLCVRHLTLCYKEADLDTQSVTRSFDIFPVSVDKIPPQMKKLNHNNNAVVINETYQTTQLTDTLSPRTDKPFETHNQNKQSSAKD